MRKNKKQTPLSVYMISAKEQSASKKTRKPPVARRKKKLNQRRKTSKQRYTRAPRAVHCFRAVAILKVGQQTELADQPPATLASSLTYHCGEGVPCPSRLAIDNEVVGIARSVHRSHAGSNPAEEIATGKSKHENVLV